MPTKKESTPFWAYIVAIPLFALFFLWYNHLFVQYPVTYWQWLAVSVPLTFLSEKNPFSYILKLTSAVAMIVQCAAWAGVVKLPLFHV